MNLFAVILAGGRGKRFWPASRKQRPKQFLSIVGQETMIQQTVSRITPIIPPENIMVITSESLKDRVLETVPDITNENILLEPVGRNTTPAIAWASMILHKRNPDAVLAVLASDHVIGDVSAFQSLLQTAGNMALKSSSIVTPGIQPDRPETGYGYIKLADEIDFPGEFDCYHVDRFVEKPDLEKAVEYMHEGTYVWNSGMFIFTAARMINEIKKYQPKIYLGIAEIVSHDNSTEIIRKIFPDLPDISVDYGIIEKTDHICSFKVTFQWADVGSWEALYDHLEKYGDGNRTESSSEENLIFHNCRNTLVHGNKRLIVTIGLEDIIVVDTEDAVLVCKKENAQDVGNIVKILEDNPKWNKYL